MRSHDTMGGAGEREEEEVAEESIERGSMGEGEGGGSDTDRDTSDSFDQTDQFVCVNLEEIRKDVQCPICLGIIRKTRTVMECLHRFCRDCIDKSMRLGNNECPACRTHCASRRSLRDDPNFDALIAALYPDIDRFEKEELSFNEEEKRRNKMIQDSIAETFRRQSEVAGKKSAAKSPVPANARRSRKRGTGSARDVDPSGSDNDERQEQQDNIEEVNVARNGTHSSEEQSPPPPEERPKRRRKSRHSTNEEREIGEIENLQDSLNSSLLITWGRNGTRSRHARVPRLTKLIQHLRNSEEENNELNLNVNLVPLNGSNSPEMEKPYISCRPSVSISHLCHLVSIQNSCLAENVEIYMKKQSVRNSSGVFILSGEKSLTEILPFASLEKGELCKFWVNLDHNYTYNVLLVHNSIQEMPQINVPQRILKVTERKPYCVRSGTHYDGRTRGRQA
ncbi:putative E3 ubiquitin-protein ligase RING1a isoform X1 [Carex littledalei]|uniref:Putative E3 ubiquitin-protein ligase RING1a isoform X1 n=1 Tax=Carex littledalei TaxID=544730 RepID=A0A833QUL3_9POAL|nr:putative E3 ubiquitin-protein ligase RING1a isoform X1 [Carex littledalei]